MDCNQIQAGSAVIIAILTGFYVYYTSKLLKEAEKQRMDDKKPVIVFRFRHIENSLGHKVQIQDRLINIGSGPAFDIQLFSNATFSSDGHITDWRTDGKLKPWHSNYPIDNVLGPEVGDPDLQICFISSSSRSCLKEPKALFEVVYNDVFGRSFKTHFKDLKNIFVDANK